MIPFSQNGRQEAFWWDGSITFEISNINIKLWWAVSCAVWFASLSCGATPSTKHIPFWLSDPFWTWKISSSNPQQRSIISYSSATMFLAAFRSITASFLRQSMNIPATMRCTTFFPIRSHLCFPLCSPSMGILPSWRCILLLMWNVTLPGYSLPMSFPKPYACKGKTGGSMTQIREYVSFRSLCRAVEKTICTFSCTMMYWRDCSEVSPARDTA